MSQDAQEGCLERGPRREEGGRGGAEENGNLVREKIKRLRGAFIHVPTNRETVIRGVVRMLRMLAVRKMFAKNKQRVTRAVPREDVGLIARGIPGLDQQLVRAQKSTSKLAA